MLRVDGLCAAYGELEVLHRVSLTVDAGQFVSVIGPNGAGKTTLLRVLSGLHPITRGTVVFDGEPIAGLPPDLICERGFVHVPEGRLLFPGMSVREHLELGAYGRRARMHLREQMEYVLALFPILRERQAQLAGTLSGGEQQMLAVARALMAQPRLLALDEPSLGLAPRVAAEIFAALRRLNHEGLTILLISQEVTQALRMAHRAYVLETGRVILDGPGPALLHNAQIVASYLGIVSSP
ncbi:MAG: ABC transporter ATP-binding protein [Armatimonadota bacterium]|nr:ABC transporter ATP-binding protein [Armatimonadota bacterium]MDR7470709.1 ABC transporter ATP-binding protein [Armatimonadota bacterium]MDR7475674.1 ABC transporter ATP-binding protein [Armatimonadota bacterium]MDR7540348.1 ABC transporter ATP-binding protein [Armatimonadota bacterium]